MMTEREQSKRGAEGVPPEIPVFHPVRQRSAESWFPGNDAAALLVHLDHAYDDVRRLAQLRQREPDPYTKKLLLKYIVVELREMIPLVERLQTLVMQAPVYEVGQEPMWRSLSRAEHDDARRLFKQFSQIRKHLEADLTEIRNRIGAHRSIDPWKEVMRSWDALEPELFQPMVAAIPEVFNLVCKLDIYEWNRQPAPESFQVLGGPLRF
jgi:hypothetical protein